MTQKVIFTVQEYHSYKATGLKIVSITLGNHIVVDSERGTRNRGWKRHVQHQKIDKNGHSPEGEAMVVTDKSKGFKFCIRMTASFTAMSLSFATRINLLVEVIEPSPN